MKALDTNIIVRFLVKDDEPQARKVYQEFKRAEVENRVLFVPALVVLEVIWVLDAVYGISRKEIVTAIEELLLMPILAFEAHSVLRSFSAAARQTSQELADLLIAHMAAGAGCKTVLTFDKKAARYPLFEELR